MCYAEKWDNVGLLIQPSQDIEIQKILLTNDLTEKVMSEAIETKTNLIISYHPPIFQGLKRLTMASWKERIVIQCMENKIALYSPHTVWDCVGNGTSEWLANSLPVKSINPAIPNLINPKFGAGRVCNVEGSLTLKEAIGKIKKYTGLRDVRVAVAVDGNLDSTIQSFACCPGSGASVLKEILTPINLFITGEISHHELLDASAKNIHVIMLNHSNSERGYLHVFSGICENLLDNTDSVEIFISKVDEDPLSTY